MTIRDVQDRFAERIFGRRLQSDELSHQSARNFIALAVLASDAMSSVAYATEEILIILNTAALSGFALLGFSGNSLSIPIAIAIALLIGIVTISYRQTIFSNPAGGGGYRVAKENLGEELAQVTTYFLENLTLVNINSSPAEELTGVLGVSDQVADAIIARRERQPFTNTADLRTVAGVDPEKVEKRKSRILF